MDQAVVNTVMNSGPGLTSLSRRKKCICFFVCFHFGLPVAVSPVEMHRLVREPKRAHPRLGEASAALPGVADGKPHAAVSQPPAVTLVVFLETPGGVKMADQRQLGSLTSASLYRLVEGERPRYVGDGACRKKKFNLVCHIFLAAVETNTGQVFFPLRNFPITSHQQMLLSSVSLPSVPLSH